MTTDVTPTVPTQELCSVFTTGLPEIFSQLQFELL